MSDNRGLWIGIIALVIIIVAGLAWIRSSKTNIPYYGTVATSASDTLIPPQK